MATMIIGRISSLLEKQKKYSNNVLSTFIVAREASTSTTLPDRAVEQRKKNDSCSYSSHDIKCIITVANKLNP